MATDDEQAYRAAEAAVWDHWGASPRERWVQLGHDGPRLRVQEVGDPDAPPVLFVHGVGIAGTCWADLASRLTDVRCLLLDRPGCGLSEPLTSPPGLDGLPELADALVAGVLDGLGLDRAHLVSNSMGGYFTLRHAAAHPGRVDRVLHFGWSLGAPIAELPLVMRLAEVPGLNRLMARLPVSQRAVRSMLRVGGMRSALADGRIPDVGIRWNAAVQNHTDTRIHDYRLTMGSSIRAMTTTLGLPPELLGRISAPVHVVLGDEDPFGTPEQLQDFVDAMPNATLEVWQGAGHAVWLDDLDRAEQLARRVLTAA